MAGLVKELLIVRGVTGLRCIIFLSVALIGDGMKANSKIAVSTILGRTISSFLFNLVFTSNISDIALLC